MHLKKVFIEKVTVVGLLGVFVFALMTGPLLKTFKAQRVIPAAPSVATQPVAAVPAVLAIPESAPAAETAAAPAASSAAQGASSASRRYAAQDFRDPFENQFPVVEEQRNSAPTGVAANSGPSIAAPRTGSAPPPSAVASATSTSTSALQVQGVIWGGANPKVLINGAVYGINDTVNGATIIAIDRRGVAVNRGGTPVYYAPASPETEGKQLSQAQTGAP